MSSGASNPFVPGVILNPSPYTEVPPELLESATLLVLNEHELAQMLRVENIGEKEWPAVRTDFVFAESNAQSSRWARPVLS